MDQGRSHSGGSRVGYSLALIGAAAFAASCFLRFYRLQTGGGLVIHESLYHSLSQGPADTLLTHVGTWLFLFGGAAIVAWASIVGLRRDPPRWPPVALVAAAGAWSVTITGLLLVTAHGFSLDVGYWCLWLSVGVAMTGPIVVVASARIRAGAEERNPTGS
jgi:hypothetical protein